MCLEEQVSCSSVSEMFDYDKNALPWTAMCVNIPLTMQCGALKSGGHNQGITGADLNDVDRLG